MKTALVAGASGLAGRAIIDRLLAEGGIRVLALARRAHDLFHDVEGVEPIACDLLDRQAVAAALASHDVHYLFYTAVFTGKGGVASFGPQSDAVLRLTQAALRYSAVPARIAAAIAPGPFYRAFDRAAGAGEAETNKAMIQNVLDACRGKDSALQHVTLVTGGKYYGHHLGPRFYPGYRAPFEEMHPRAPGNNWYYAVEDYVADCQRADGSWYYSTLRPSSIMGFATGSPYNLGTSLAVYASIRKYLDEPLLLPAGPRTQTVDIEFSPAGLIAEMALWSVREPRCRNEAYNASFGARTCWKDIWGDIAAFFGMPAAFVDRAQCVGRIVRDYPPVWRGMAERFGTLFPEFDQVCAPAFMDQQFLMDWDAGYSPEKARSHGFAHTTDAPSMFRTLFTELVERRVIPDPAAIPPPREWL